MLSELNNESYLAIIVCDIKRTFLRIDPIDYLTLNQRELPSANVKVMSNYYQPTTKKNTATVITSINTLNFLDIL